MSFRAWRRVPEAGACTFCPMLATRGAVYRTAQTAGDGNSYHRHCRCDAELETDFDQATDIRVAPEDANRQIAFRNAKTNRTYRYDLRHYRVKNPPDVPMQAPVKATEQEWSRGAWRELGKDEIRAHLRSGDSPEMRQFHEKIDDLLGGRDPSDKVWKAYRNGQHTSLFEGKMSQKAVQETLADFDDAIDTLPERLRKQAIELLVPKGDTKFRASLHSAETGGYVLRGTPRIHLSPKIAKGLNWGDQSEHFAPYYEAAHTRRSVITHEMGHVVDGLLQSTKQAGGMTPSGIALPMDTPIDETLFWRRAFDRINDDTHRYARKNPAEGYAEMYAQYKIGGPGSSPIADAYARRYGWN